MSLRLIAAVAAASLFAASAASAQSGPVSVSLDNNTDYTLTHIYISLPSTNDWEDDILGAQVVEPGETVQIVIDDGLPECEYDVRFDFSDGDTMQGGSVDFCAINGESFSVQ